MLAYDTIRPLRLGTRASPLAVAQAEQVRRSLLQRFSLPESHITLVPIVTSGDREVHKSFEQWGFKGLFTRELEQGLLNGTLDLAVHSMKDMPSELPSGLVIAGMPKREDPRDAFLSLEFAGLNALAHGAVVGTSSVRRAAQLRFIRPDIQIVPFRGNVQTRLKKLEDKVASATLLAAAGLNRLGLNNRVTELLDPASFLPAAAQGAIGIECRENDEAVIDAIAQLSDSATMQTVGCERAMLATLDGSCRTPIAGFATLEGSRIHLRAMLIAPDGSACLTREGSGDVADSERIGRDVGLALRREAGDRLTSWIASL